MSHRRVIDLPEKVLSMAALIICIELVLFKFLPDLSTALLQKSTSKLAAWDDYRAYYMTPGSVHYARFLGNRIVLQTATWVGQFVHSEDIRLHPLRIAAGIVTPIYAAFGAVLAMGDGTRYAWRYFMVPYSVAALIGLYVFYPGDMPSFAMLSIALYYLVNERLGPALLFTLLTGLFRESSLHAVFFVLLWALCSTSRPLAARVGWLVAFGAAFAAEYLIIRHFFAGPLTTICSLGLAVIFPIGCLVRLRSVAADDWRRRFFQLNCFAFPLWIVFYRMLNGNISEFRLMLPVILPCIYGIAYAPKLPREAAQRQPVVGAGQTPCT
jgi:hypothetical protein